MGKAVENVYKHESIIKVSKLTDYKRKHLEKKIVSTQCDKLLFEKARGGFL